MSCQANLAMEACPTRHLDYLQLQAVCNTGKLTRRKTGEETHALQGFLKVLSPGNPSCQNDSPEACPVHYPHTAICHCLQNEFAPTVEGMQLVQIICKL